MEKKADDDLKVAGCHQAGTDHAGCHGMRQTHGIALCNSDLPLLYVRGVGKLQGLVVAAVDFLYGEIRRWIAADQFACHGFAVGKADSNIIRFTSDMLVGYQIAIRGKDKSQAGRAQWLRSVVLRIAPFFGHGNMSDRRCCFLHRIDDCLGIGVEDLEGVVGINNSSLHGYAATKSKPRAYSNILAAEPQGWPS